MSELKDDIRSAIKSVGKDWKKAKRQADKEDKVQRRDLQRMRSYSPPRTTIRSAAFRVMERAYMKASANDTLPANARQIMYAARPLVLDLTDGECWKNSSYFTQKLLPDYMERYDPPWDVVYDARGKLVEPHTGERADLGTLEVRDYIARWGNSMNVPTLSHRVPTIGPGNRYRFTLFVEKEGFDQLWDAVDLAGRWDLAIMSTKGMSVTAARRLVDELSQKAVTILVLRDFDKAGFSIVHTLGTDTSRYQFMSVPKIIDLGLRLGDVEEMGLEGEAVTYKQRIDPRWNLRECGATEEECSFLVRERWGSHWEGQRVELNAMTSDQLVKWLEDKLREIGVDKVIPDSRTLKEAYRRALLIAAAKKTIAKMRKEFDAIAIPDDLSERVKKIVEVETTVRGKKIAWDDAIWRLAQRSVAGQGDKP